MKDLMNPFLNRNKVTDPQEFFGRTEEVTYLLRNLTYHEPQSVSVVGERRSGKSSLLTYMYRLLSSKNDEPFRDKSGKLTLDEDVHGMLFDEQGQRLSAHDKLVCILIDPEEAVIGAVDALLWVMIDELVTEDSRLAQYLDYYPPRGENDKDVPKRHPQTVLNNLLRSAWKDGYRFVILLDEFELIATDPELRKHHFLHYLRGISDNYALAYVTSSRCSLTKVCDMNDPYMSPFENNFSKSQPVGRLTRSEALDLIHGVLRRSGYEGSRLSPDEEKAIDLSGRNPYYLKVACSYLFDQMDGNPQNDDEWRNEFMKEAKVEYDRMWLILEPEEKDWIFLVNKGGVTDQHLGISEPLTSLYERGVVVRETDGRIELFSESFRDYVNDYVNKNNLERRYATIESEIAGSSSLCDHEELEQAYEHLARLTSEWRDQKETPRSRVCVKSEHLHAILGGFLRLHECFEETNDKAPTGATQSDTQDQADKTLKEVAGYFEEDDWFGEEEEQIPFEVGNHILLQIVEFLQKHDRQKKFGNGFDQILLTKISFIRKHNSEYFHEYADEVKAAFDRLMAVYDYSRAMQVLQLHMKPFIRRVASFFFESPLTTILGIIAVPLVLIYYVQNCPSPKPWNSISSNLWALLLFVYYGYFAFQMHRAMLFDSAAALQHSQEISRRLIFKETIFGTLGVSSALFFTLCTNSNIAGTVAKATSFTVFAILFALLWLLAWLLIASGIWKKVISFEVASRRSAYFCSVEFLRSFFLVLVLYLLVCGVVALMYGANPPEWKQGEPKTLAHTLVELAKPVNPAQGQSSNGSDAGGNGGIDAAFGWLFCDVRIGGYPINIRLVMLLALIGGPIASLSRVWNSSP